MDKKKKYKDLVKSYVGRKQKTIPHIPGTMDSIVESFFAKDKAYIKAKKKEQPNEKKEKKILDLKPTHIV